MAVITELRNPKSSIRLDSPVSPVSIDRVRLHISPLNPKLLTTLLPPSVLPTASGISYHSIQTFPERDYGFVELPSEEATRLKKKLNGLILKGQKMKIEEARPKRRKQRSEGNEVQEETAEQESSLRKRKRAEGTVPGIQLPKGRKVERGWTKPKSAEKNKTKPKKGLRSEASAFTDGPECLFKTKLPPNAPKTKAAGKKSKSKGDRERTVHEFTNTTKHPSFLRSGTKSASTKVTAEYQDGVGWVNEQGEVVEKIEHGKRERNTSQRKASDEDKASNRKAMEKNRPQDTEVVHDDDYTSSSGSSGSEDGEPSDEAAGSDEKEDSVMRDDTTADQGALKINVPDYIAEQKSSIAKSNKKSPKLFIETKSTQPHPFETLFKRPSIAEGKSSQEANIKGDARTPFNFFSTDAAEDEDVVDTHPMTPHTQLELRERTWRSAAPTPDTAAIGKYFPTFPEGGSGSSEDEDDIMEDQSNVKEPDQPGGERRSSRTGLGIGGFDGKAFEKSFYERRGETNRAWKQRRRETSKQKRKMENKKRSKAT